MSFQTYIDNAEAKTGKKVSFFAEEARKLGFTKPGQITNWLKSEYGLGHGHANAVAHVILNPQGNTKSDDEKIDTVFSGVKSAWKPAYQSILAQVEKFGPEFAVDATKSYVSLLKGGKKFGILQPSSKDRFDIGIKAKGKPFSDRFEDASSWNPMVTHRVRINNAEEIDEEILDWLQSAYQSA